MKRIVFCLLLAFAARGALACSCIQIRSASENALGADAVFAGVVESIEELENRKGRTVTFRVFQWWKGQELTESVTVHTGYGMGDCGYPVEAGQSYLVFARLTPLKQLSMSICSRSAALVCAMDDVKELGGPIKFFEEIEREALIAREQPYTTYWRPCVTEPLLAGERGLRMDKHCSYRVDAIVDREGSVRSLMVVQRPKLEFCPADSYIVERAMQWKFRPATIDGVPVESRLTRVSLLDPATESEWKKRQENR